MLVKRYLIKKSNNVEKTKIFDIIFVNLTYVILALKQNSIL